MSLRIAETFASIQGEGIWVGTPSTFIRISGCNLRCVWCDTPYASWRPEGDLQTVEEILEDVRRRGVRHVVVTGGEPMLFDDVEPLAARLRRLGHVITIETAGTVFRELACDLMSISPKLANSTPQNDPWQERHEQTRNDRAPLKRLIQTYDVQLKFVVNPDQGDDLEEIDELLQDLPPVPPERILLMAEGTDADTLHRRGRLLAPICLERGWRLSPRFHVDLFGNKRAT